MDILGSVATQRAPGEAVWLPDILGPELLSPLLTEMESVRTKVHRNYVPTQKKGGSVSYVTLREQAPQLLALYKHPALIHLLERITGERLMVCPEGVLSYTGKRFTVLIGLTDRSSSRLRCRMNTNTRGREPTELALATAPGMLVAFNGDKL